MRVFRVPTSPLLFTLWLLALGVFTTQAAGKKDLDSVFPEKGSQIYTQFSLFHEKGVHRTTNYRKGFLIPANTLVTFLKATRKDITVELADGQKLKIANVEKFSGEDLAGIYTRTFSAAPTNLTSFTEMENKAIRTGSVQPGMSKAAVIVALGYPPKHQTSSLELDQWRYWHNRFNTFKVHFIDDKVTEIEE
jgi:hypothetical protein